MSDHAGKRSRTASGHDAAAAAAAAPAPGRRTLAEQLDGAAPHETAPATARGPAHVAAVEPIAATARPTLQALFGGHLAATRGSAEPPAASPADAGPAGAPADAADRGEEAMDALAHDIVEHPLLHDKLAHVPDDVLEQLVRQVGRRALIRIATGGAELPTAAPASAQVPTEGLQAPDAAGPLPARTGLLARVQSRPADGPEGHAAEQDPEELAGAEAHDAHGDHPADERAEPSAAVQRRTGDRADDAPDPAAIHASARRGLATPATQLPFRDTIQRVFGRHDLSSIQAHVGPDAARSAHEMGADAYATGNHVVLGPSPDLFTTAHEAAHVIQQRAGVHCKGGVGEADDRYEQHADEVAQRVVEGKSAEDLLDRDAGGSHERGGLQEPPVPAQSAAPGPPIVQRHHEKFKWLTRAAGRGFGARSYVGASRASLSLPSASPASEEESPASPTDTETDSTPSSTSKPWSKLRKRRGGQRTSWIAPRPLLPGMAAQPASGQILPPPVLGVGPRPRRYSSFTEQDVPESSAGDSAAFEQYKEKDELPVPTTSAHVGKARNSEEKEAEEELAEGYKTEPEAETEGQKMDPLSADQAQTDPDQIRRFKRYKKTSKGKLEFREWWKKYGRKPPPNKHGKLGNPDHISTRDKLFEMASNEFPGDRVVMEQSIQGLKTPDGRTIRIDRSPDVTVIDKDGVTVKKIYEAARFNKNGSLVSREAAKLRQYNGLGIESHFEPVQKK